MSLLQRSHLHRNVADGGESPTEPSLGRLPSKDSGEREVGTEVEESGDEYDDEERGEGVSKYPKTFSGGDGASNAWVKNGEMAPVT